MGDNWYLLQFKPNSHRLAELNLTRQGFKTFLPLEETTYRKASKFIYNIRPLFPGYMFVNTDSVCAPWRKINGTRGVSRLVTFDHSPKPIPTEFIVAIKRRCNSNGILKPTRDFFPGDKVEISGGPFASFIATIEFMESKKRIWVIMDLMGQTTRVKVSTEQVKKIN